MNLFVLSLVISLAGVAAQDGAVATQSSGTVSSEMVVVDNSYESVGAVAVGKPVGHRPTATGHGWLVDWFGPMPQTCYQPRYGCYPGNPRTIHRYPAFHGYYYRNPYNYRHYFEYPWHAQPNEPRDFQPGAAEVVTSDAVAGENLLVPQPDPSLKY